jgi:hypothetical protein
MSSPLHYVLDSLRFIPDTIHFVSEAPKNTSTLWNFISPSLSGLFVGILTAFISFWIAKRTIWADIVSRSKNDWKDSIMKYFSEIASESKSQIPDLKKINFNISQLRLFINAITYPSHKKLDSKLIEIELFINGDATHIQNDKERNQLIDDARELTRIVCKEAWDDIQKQAGIKSKKPT